MAKITAEELREIAGRKALGEETWIRLESDKSEPKIEIRIDYPSQAQHTEIRRLERIFQFIGGRKEGADVEHPDEYFLRCVIKDVRNLELDSQPYGIQFDRGMVKKEEGGLIDILKVLFLCDEAIWRSQMKLYFSDLEKKKQPSPPG